LAHALPYSQHQEQHIRNVKQEDFIMKRLSVMVAMLLVLGTVSLALAGPGGMGCGMGPGMGGGMGRGMGGGMGGGCGLGPAMWDQLNLNADQLAKAQALRDAQLKDVVPIQNQLFAKRNEMRLLWNQPNPDAAQLKAKQKEISDLQSQMREKNIQFQLDFRKLLTPEQQAKLSSAGGMGRGHGPQHRGMGNW
jgi:Spy/CpxP family protein refolding chaperone